MTETERDRETERQRQTERDKDKDRDRQTERENESGRLAPDLFFFFKETNLHLTYCLIVLELDIR